MHPVLTFVLFSEEAVSTSFHVYVYGNEFPTVLFQGTSNDEPVVSAYQVWIDHLDAKHYYQLWTDETLEKVRIKCNFSSADQVKFPPHHYGMSAITSLEYFLSRNQSLFPQDGLHFPWPLAIALKHETTLRECKWIWRRMEEGKKAIRYSR